MESIHQPVMLEESIELLAPILSAPKAIIVDATLGMGGHSQMMLQRFSELRVLGLDRDPDAIRIARERLAEYGSRFLAIHTVYDQIEVVLHRLRIRNISAVLFDLGVSSLQLDEVDRGFSYSKDAPLDMRMNGTDGETAAEVIANSSESELKTMFREFGEERLAGRYAKAIVVARAIRPIARSAQLVQIIQEVTPITVQRQGHPAKRVFQALRIVVNDELGALERALPIALHTLRLGGRIVVLSYQSLEDRLVKQTLQRASSSGTPIDLPMELSDHQPEFSLLLRGARRASQTEQDQNPRAKPVRLRAAERIRLSAADKEAA